MWTATFQNGNKVIAPFVIWAMIKPFIDDLVSIEYSKKKSIKVDYISGKMFVNDQVVDEFNPSEIKEMVPACFHNMQNEFNVQVRRGVIGMDQPGTPKLNYTGLGFKGKIDGRDVRKIIRLYPNGRYDIDANS